MSLSPSDLKVYKSIDNRLNFNQKEDYVIDVGALNNTMTIVPSSQTSSTSITFIGDPPSNTVAMSRVVYAQIVVRLEFLSNGNGGAYTVFNNNIPYTPSGNHLINSITSSVRSFPLHKILSSLKVKIDNSSESIVPEDLMDCLERYLSDEDKRKYLSMCPTMATQYQRLVDYTIYGEQMNSMGRYGDCGYHIPNGNFSQLHPVSGAVEGNNFREIYDLRITEPLFIPPMLFKDRSIGRALYHCSNFSVYMNFGNLQRLWCQSENSIQLNPVGGYTAIINPPNSSFQNSAALLVQYLTPQSYQLTQSLITYPLQDWTVYPNPSKVINAGQTEVMVSNNLQLSVVPSKLYIYAQVPASDKTISSADNFGTIEKLSILFNNNSSQLADADKVQLYKMSADNGLQMSFQGYDKFCGAPVCIDVSRDLSLNATEVPGRLKQTLLNIKATVKNNSTYNLTYTLYVLAVTEGVLLKSPSNTSSMLGVVQASDILEAPELPLELQNNLNFDEYMGHGGNIFGSVKRYINQGKKAIDKYGPTLAKVAKAAKTGWDIGTEYGPEIVDLITALVGAGYTKEEAQRMALNGGKMMSKNKMNGRMVKYGKRK